MLTLPPKFKQALGNGTRTSLYPLVRIYKGYQIDDTIPNNAEAINLSIKETTIKNLDTENDTYESYIPLLLNSPSISSKADIINNKYTISSVSLSISNAPYNGKIFSDEIPSLLNAVVQVYYAANGLNSLEDCLLVYTGTIRRYSQSKNDIRLTLEDLTEQKLKTKIPSTLIEDELVYKQDDIGKPYPLVYGYVDNSPTIKKGLDTLELEKPNTEISGYWLGDYYSNPVIKEGHPLVDAGYLRQNKYLSAYKEGFVSIYEKGPKHFGTGIYDVEELEFYSFNNATSDVSPNIILNSDAYIETTQPDDEEETFAIPSRMYRPIVDVSFYSLNPLTGNPHDPNQKFIGYRNDDGSMQRITNNIGQFDDLEGTNNDDQMAKDLYDEFWDNGPENGEILKFWQPTKVNEARETGDISVLNDFIDENWKSYYNGYEEAGKFPIDIIQNDDSNSGLNITSSVTNFSDFTVSGCFARLYLNQDSKIGDFPCVTKIFYDACFFTNGNIINTTGNTTRGSQPRFASFWAETFLRVFNSSGPSYGIQDLDTWFEFINTYLAEPPSFPNATNNMYIDQRASDIGVENEYEDWGRLEYEDGLLHNDGYSNIIDTFNTTNAFDSIQFGKGTITRGGANYVSANLKEIYVIQDFLLEDYANLDYYASVGGRVKEGNIITNAQGILENILTDELLYEGVVNNQDTNIQDNWQYAFTLNEQTEAKSIFEGMFKSSILIPSFDSAGQFKFIGIKQIIDSYEDVQFISNDDVLNYSFELTKLDDVYNSVNVRYKKNYGDGEYDRQTGYNIGGGIYENYDELTTDGLGYAGSDAYDINYYGKLPSEAKLEVESNYIRDKYTAEKLQKRLLMWYCNQHLITKIELPPHYMYLEAGDYIKLSELLGGKLAFGYDYTTPERRNGQLIYDVFFVTKVSKSLNKISIEAVQVHRGEYGYPSISEEDTGDIVNGNGDDVTENNQIPNAEDDPNYSEDSIGTDEFEVVEDDYLRIQMSENRTLNNNQVVGIVSTNMDESWVYNIWVRNLSVDLDIDGDGEIDIAAGSYEIGDKSGMDLVNHALTMQDSNGYITIEKKFEIFPQGAVIEFVLEVKNTQFVLEEGFDQLGINEEDITIGDLNNDLNVNILDVVRLVQIILGHGDEPPNLEEIAGNANQDSVLNVQDVIILINQILGQ